MTNQKLLLLSDTHFPAEHPDYFKWIKKIKSLTKWTQVIHLGDLCDMGSLSFYDSSAEMDSPVIEINKAKKSIRKLEKLFPKIDILYGNHDIRVTRKAEKYGIPREYIKDLNHILDIKANWNWHEKLIVKLTNGNRVFFTHHFKSSVLQSSKELGCSLICSHQHTKSELSMWSSPTSLNFAMIIGSSIDPKHENFRYQKHFIKRPVISVASIGYSGYCQPCIHSMPLDNNGRWTGQV